MIQMGGKMITRNFTLPPPWQANPPLSRKQGQGGERASQFLYRSPWTDYIRCNQTIMVFGRYIGKKKCKKKWSETLVPMPYDCSNFLSPLSFPFPFFSPSSLLDFLPQILHRYGFLKISCQGESQRASQFRYIGHSCRSVGRGGG